MWNACFDLLHSFVWNISHSKKNLARYCNQRENFFMQSARYSGRILIKLKYSRQLFENSSDIKSHQNPSSENRVVPCGWADGPNEAIVAFHNFANAPKIQFVRHRKFFTSIIKTNQLMVYGEIIVVHYKNHANHIRESCGNNLQVLSVQRCDTRSNYRPSSC